MQQSLDGPHRHGEHGSNFFVRLLLHIKQGDYLPLLYGQLVDEATERCAINTEVAARVSSTVDITSGSLNDAWGRSARSADTLAFRAME